MCPKQIGVDPPLLPTYLYHISIDPLIHTVSTSSSSSFFTHHYHHHHNYLHHYHHRDHLSSSLWLSFITIITTIPYSRYYLRRLKHPSGEVTCLSIDEYVSLPPDSSLSVKYHSAVVAQGFMSIKKMWWMDGWIYGRMNNLMNGWVDGIDGWIEKLISSSSLMRFEIV